MTQDIKSMLRLGGVLCAFTLIVSLLLAGVNMLTAPVIAQNEINALNAALQTVFPEAMEFPEVTVSDEDKAQKGIQNAYQAMDASGAVVGMAVQVAPSGFGGPINMIVGVREDGTIVSAEILSMAETPGLGTKAGDAKFIDQFIDKGASLSVIKSGTPDNNQILAITGATVTSAAVTKGVNDAQAFAVQSMQ